MLSSGPTARLVSPPPRGVGFGARLFHVAPPSVLFQSAEPVGRPAGALTAPEPGMPASLKVGAPGALGGATTAPGPEPPCTQPARKATTNATVRRRESMASAGRLPRFKHSRSVL